LIKIYRFIVIGIILCLAAATLGYFWATANIESLYTYRSPLDTAVPSPRNPLGEPATERVILVLVDGLRLDTSFKADVMPTLNDLRQKGAYAVMHSQPTSFSMPGYTTLLTGAWPEMNGGSLMNLEFEGINPFFQDDLISAIHWAGGKTAISGFIWFQKMVPEIAVDASFYTAGEDRNADELVMKNALSWLENRNHSFILIHLDQVDYAGHHEGGVRDARWDAAAMRVDAMIAQITEKMDFRRDTLVVLSDHGHIQIGGHGGQDAEVLLEPFVLVGKGVIPGDYKEIQMVDVAPTLAVLLGADIPAASQGEVLTDMLVLPESTLEILPQAISNQQLNLLEAYFKAMDETPHYLAGEMIDSTIGNIRMEEIKNKQLWAERLPRYLMVGVVLLAAGFWIYRKRSQNLVWFLTGAIVYHLIFNFRYAILDGMTYSLSSVIGEMELIAYCALTSIISFLIAWFFVMIGRKAFKQTPLKAAETSMSLSFVVLAVLFVPALLHFAVDGWAIDRFLPNFALQFVAVIALIQMIFVAVLSIILAGISAGIAWGMGRESKNKA
jgi:hypothetical protein